MKKIVLILMGCSIFFTGCFMTPEPEINKVEYRAFLVGVSFNLSSPPYNVARMESIFNNCKFGDNETQFTTINKLLDLDGTKQNILDGIASTFEDADDNDVSYFYWNGHGSDNVIPHVATSDFISQDMETWLTVDDLEQALSAISGTKVVLLDTCHSGSFIGKANNNFNNSVIEIFSQNSRDLLNKDKYQVIVSCEGDSVCWENPNATLPYCYFTMGVYRGCLGLQADTDEDGVINLTELWSYAYWWALQNKCNSQYAQYFPEGSTFPIVEY